MKTMTEQRHVEDEFNDWVKNLEANFGVNADELWAKIEERWENIQLDARWSEMNDEHE